MLESEFSLPREAVFGWKHGFFVIFLHESPDACFFGAWYLVCGAEEARLSLMRGFPRFEEPVSPKRREVHDNRRRKQAD